MWLGLGEDSNVGMEVELYVETEVEIKLCNFTLPLVTYSKVRVRWNRGFNLN